VATEITVQNMLPNGGTPVDGDSLAAGDYYVDTNARTGVVDVKLPELLLLHVTAGGAAVTVTVGPGNYPPALASGQGPIEVVVPAGESAIVGPFESGRVQSEHVNVGTPAEPEIVHSPVMVGLDATATVAAFRFPRQT